MKCWIGIDPGVNGAMARIAYYADDDIDVDVTILPKAGKKELDLPDIRHWLKQALTVVGQRGIYVAIEKVTSMPKQGVTSMFTFGRAYGQLEGIVSTLGLSYVLVTPTQWKKYVLVGTAKDKDAAVTYCRRMYPDVSLLPTDKSRKPNENMADALCIATYSRLLWP